MYYITVWHSPSTAWVNFGRSRTARATSDNLHKVLTVHDLGLVLFH